MKIPFAAVVLLALALTVQGQLLRDDFSTSGSLSGSIPDIGNSWTTIAGTPGQLQVSNGHLQLTTGTEDVQSTFGIQSAITLFAGFILNSPTPPTTAGRLAISFRAAEGFIGRVFLSSGTSASTFRIGIENNLDNPVFWPTQLDASTAYRIVLGFTENGASDRTSLWVNPLSINDPSVTESPQAVTAGLTGFSFLQSSRIASFTVDDLYVGTSFEAAAAIPEPSVVGLATLGFPALLGRFRRRTRVQEQS